MISQQKTSEFLTIELTKPDTGMILILNFEATYAP
jgi:hypothetical protein